MVCIIVAIASPAREQFPLLLLNFRHNLGIILSLRLQHFYHNTRCFLKDKNIPRWTNHQEQRQMQALRIPHSNNIQRVCEMRYEGINRTHILQVIDLHAKATHHDNSNLFLSLAFSIMNTSLNQNQNQVQTGPRNLAI